MALQKHNIWLLNSRISPGVKWGQDISIKSKQQFALSGHSICITCNRWRGIYSKEKILALVSVDYVIC